MIYFFVIISQTFVLVRVMNNNFCTHNFSNFLKILVSKQIFWQLKKYRYVDKYVSMRNSKTRRTKKKIEFL